MAGRSFLDDLMMRVGGVSPFVRQAYGGVNQAMEPDVAYRGQNLPFVEYDDKSIGWGMPQVAYDLADSWNQFTNAAEAARGIPHTTDESFPRDKDAALVAALPVVGGAFSGLGSRAAGRAVSGRALEGFEAPRPLTSSPVEAGRFAPSVTPLEEVAPGQGFRARNAGADLMARAKQSQFWPEWGDKYPERAMYSTLEQEAAAPWNAAISDVMRVNPTMERWQAEAQVMQTRPELGLAYQDARRAWREHDKGRPLSAGEEWWDDLHALPGTPPDNSGLVDLMKQKFMVAGHPDIDARRLAREGQQAIPRLPKPDDETLFSNPKEAAPAGMLATLPENHPLRQYAADRAAVRAMDEQGPAVYDQMVDAYDNVQSYKPELSDDAIQDAVEKMIADEAVDPSLRNLLQAFKVPESHARAVTLEAGKEAGIGRLTATRPFANDEKLFSNPKEAAPAGMLASSGLDRMRVEDATRPRSIPDAGGEGDGLNIIEMLMRRHGYIR